jgi:hypothetical protein
VLAAHETPALKSPEPTPKLKNIFLIISLCSQTQELRHDSVAQSTVFKNDALQCRAS